VTRIVEIITPPTTAFDASGAVDHAATRALLEHVEPYVDAVFAAGTTGEFPALDLQESTAVIADAVAVLGSDRVIAHVGAPSVRQALAHLAAAESVGTRRFAAITPYYLTASDDGIMRYYEALVAATEGELYAYIFPDVACSDVSPELLSRLAGLGIAGVKVSGAASRKVDAYRAAAPQLKLWSGNDADLPHIVRAGGRGTVSGCSGVAPAAWARLRAALIAEDAVEIAAANHVVEALVAALGPSIARLKYGLDLIGLPGGDCRMPIDPPSPEVRAQIVAALELAGMSVTAPAK
jgi:4-hydroxy-tetrahydrodipicolinate synthase